MPAWFWVGSPRPWSRIIVGCDHAGWELKQGLLAQWRRMAMEVKDMGTHSPEPCHYGEIAARVVPEVLRHWPTALGVLICGSGQGMAMAANRWPRARAALVWNETLARWARAHNDAFILCLPGRLLTVPEAWKIFEVFIQTPFEGGRHIPRIELLDRLPESVELT